jgi:hypothetical protein
MKQAQSFDDTCNKIRATLRYMEAHSAQASLTAKEKFDLARAARLLDARVTEILARASWRVA